MLSGAEKRRRLERALEYGGRTHRASDVAERLKEGKAQLWENGDGAIITELYHYPLRSTVSYWLVLGRLGDCLSLQSDIDAWAIKQGCTMATAIGRRGWERAAAASGWKAHMNMYYKDLVP